MSRGMLTEEIKVMAKELLDIEIDITQLRLMPYVQYCVMNVQNIDPNHVNNMDREALSKWRKDGLIKGGASTLSVSKKFWDAMSEILWHSYVNLN